SCGARTPVIDNPIARPTAPVAIGNSHLRAAESRIRASRPTSILLGRKRRIMRDVDRRAYAACVPVEHQLRIGRKRFDSPRQPRGIRHAHHVLASFIPRLAQSDAIVAVLTADVLPFAGSVIDIAETSDRLPGTIVVRQHRDAAMTWGGLCSSEARCPETKACRNGHEPDH